MSIIINTNISSMQGIRALNKSTGSLNQALERLSTGYRINSSKDDAACCAISASLRKDISSLTVAQSNAQIGQSMIDTANGSLSNISNLLQRMRDLTEQAANSTYGADERSAMQNEIDNLISEMYRAKESTEFNGKQVLGAETTQRVTEEEAIAQGYKIVKTAKQLQENLTTSADCKVMLFADIDLSELDEVDGSNWTAVGKLGDNFRGTLDGNGFTVYNLKINKPEENYQGLIGLARGATIKNISLENVDVEGRGSVGGLVGETLNETTISNCKVSGSVTGINQTGGLIGRTSITSITTNCSSSGTVIGKTYTGGLVGYNINDSTITNCSSSGTVTGTSYVGGLVGGNQNYSTITNSSSSAIVTGLSQVGGLVGLIHVYAAVTNSTSSGTVTGTGGQIGGLTGVLWDHSSISDCSTSATVTRNGNENWTGGFIGHADNYVEITNCSSSGNVTGKNYTGGFIGSVSRNVAITNCSSSGTVTGNGYHTGGFAGRIDADSSSSITNSKTTSKVTATNPASTGAFLGSFVTGTIDGNEYNSTINGEGMRAVGTGLTPTTEQVQDNKKLVIDPINPLLKEICAINLQVGIKDDEFSTIKVDTGFEIGCFNISLMSEFGAQHALDRIDALMSKVTSKQTELGAMSNRLMTAMEYQDVQKSANIATNSVIKDADFAKESSNYIKSQILQNTTASLLATANQNPSIALMLVTGTNLRK